MFSLDPILWCVITAILLVPAGYYIGKTAALAIFNKKLLTPYLILGAYAAACILLYASKILPAFPLLVATIFFSAGFFVIIIFDRPKP